MTDLEIKECKHCGQCCLSGIPCIFGQLLFDITENNPQPCLAVEHNTDGYWCGLIRNPKKWFHTFWGERLNAWTERFERRTENQE